jgi:hypothetical protein
MANVPAGRRGGAGRAGGAAGAGRHPGPFRGSFPNTDAALALILVVVAVTEIAVGGRRQHAAASRRAGYLDGIHAAAQAVALADQVGAALATSHPAGQG